MPADASELTREGLVIEPAAYESYYGFVEPPFSLTPGPRFAYRSRSYAAALDEVSRALQRREGLIVVSGETGTGKTMLCRALLQDSDAHTFVSLVVDSCLSAEEMLAEVLSDFGVLDRTDRSSPGAAPIPRHQLLIILQRFLASLVPLGARAVLVIDEAQHLHPAVLEQIRLWANVETNDTKLLQIVLAGQPELDDLLRRPEMRQVLQRVSRRCELTRLLRDEVAQYLDHRLTVARGHVRAPAVAGTPAGVLAQAEFWRVRVTPAAARTVAALSRGVPRIINLLADRALEVGCERHTRNIDARIVRVAARRLKLLPPAVPRLAMCVAAAVAALAVLVLVPWAGHSSGQSALAAAIPGGSVGPVPPTPVAMAAGLSATGSDASPSSTSDAHPLMVQDSVNVTIASFRSEQRAEAVAAQLLDAGFPAFTRHPGGIWHQVIVGPFVSSEEAAAAQRELVAQGVAGTDVRLESVTASETPAPGFKR